MSIEIGRILHKVDFDVVKMYWKSKKNVYGIENELHLEVFLCFTLSKKLRFHSRIKWPKTKSKGTN